ncbi:hypothetical protein CHBEV_238 [Choristoneura biennis entomopoxvirus]|uniref:Uncharacterized protein n=1 Tax=Choristoneura biennis entomopoxvirus TaxID=10288 RepID=A0A916KPT2_CBEPV|nr:hypothetical protein CHBEV_238 [Choristoneura biennis entomopoxvirus]CCU55806.1 hypothetical protein CHBEV_238 [Choristoneura biennis entomopoxvirus]
MIIKEKVFLIYNYILYFINEYIILPINKYILINEILQISKILSTNENIILYKKFYKLMTNIYFKNIIKTYIKLYNNNSINIHINCDDIAKIIYTIYNDYLNHDDKYYKKIDFICKHRLLPDLFNQLRILLNGNNITLILEYINNINQEFSDNIRKLIFGEDFYNFMNEITRIYKNENNSILELKKHITYNFITRIINIFY